MMMVLRKHPQIELGSRLETDAAPTGSELSGRTLLIVGLGSSAREFALRSTALGMQGVAVRRRGSDHELAARLGIEKIESLTELDRLIPEANIVSLHVPLTVDTVKMMSQRRVELMRSGSILINVARDGLADEPALLSALTSGRPGGVGPDVLVDESGRADHPLYRHPRTVVTPHVAGRTIESSARRACFIAANIDRVAKGAVPRCSIDGGPQC